VIRTFRYRVYPTKRQELVLNSQLAICAELFNAALQERREAWQRERKSISWFDQNLQLTAIKKDRADVAGINLAVLENTLKRVHLAFGAFFLRVKRGQTPGYPRFRSVRRYDSLTFRQIGKALNGNKLRLSKIGNVRIKLHRPLEGTIKTLTVKREAGKWFALFCCEVEAAPFPFNPGAVGVDVGLTTFATLSDGSTIENPRWFRVAQAKLRRLQRRVARRQRGSNRRRKAVQLLQRFHNHVRDQRRDFQHKEARKIVNANGLIAVEDLNVKGLASGMLAKSVNDAGWSQFIFMLSYKAECAGRLLVKVDPRGTSQTCLCGATVRKTLAVREHVCLSCGLVGSRDHISAQIILGRAVPSGVNVGDLMPCVA
jgi:putative transposase